MPFVPVADTVLLELRQTLFGQRIENTLYFRIEGGFGTGEMISLMNDLLIWWTTTLAPNLSNDLSLRELVCTDLSTITGPSIASAAPTPNPTGTNGQPSLPGNSALVVSFRTLLRGRSFRGRNYVAGLGEGNVVGNTVDASVALAIRAAYAGIPAALVEAAWEWVVVSRFSGVDAEGDPIPRVAGLATPVSSVVVVDNFVDSQRRRLTGRGL